MAIGDAYVFPAFLTPVLTQLFFPKPPTTFLTCFCRGERRKYAGKKSCLNWGQNSQPPGHESDTLTTEPPNLKDFADDNLNFDENSRKFSTERKHLGEKEKLLGMSNFSFSCSVFKRLLLLTHKNQGSFGKGLKVVFYEKGNPCKKVGNYE